MSKADEIVAAAAELREAEAAYVKAEQESRAAYDRRLAAWSRKSDLQQKLLKLALEAK